MKSAREQSGRTDPMRQALGPSMAPGEGGKRTLLATG